MGSTVHAATINATATFTETPDASLAGVYDYNMTLQDTGTTTIGTFWFGWVPGAGFLSAVPTSIGSPAGWTEKTTNAGAAIQWVTTTALMNPGDVLSGFTFDSTETPAQLESAFTGTGTGAGDPQATSFVYAGAPLVGAGAQFVVTPATPEPGTVLLTLTGMGALAMAAGMKRRLLHL